MRDEIGKAVEGLTYSSESDRPMEPFELAGGAGGWPFGAEELARRLGRAGAPVEERSLYQFLARHIELTDPYDTRAQAERPRYEALRALLGRLRDPRVYRIGKIEIDCYALGDDGAGNLVGVHTVSVET